VTEIFLISLNHYLVVERPGKKITVMQNLKEQDYKSELKLDLKEAYTNPQTNTDH
jgi:hypothetical protein